MKTFYYPVEKRDPQFSSTALALVLMVSFAIGGISLLTNYIDLLNAYEALQRMCK